MKVVVTTLLLVWYTFAADFYFNRCDPGAHASCAPPGVNSSPGTNPSSPKLDIWGQINFDTVEAGSRFFFACGGKWNLSSQIYTERATRFVFDWYRHPAGPECVKNEDANGAPLASDTRPIFFRRDTIFYNRVGSHIFSHLRLESDVNNGWGIYATPPTTNLTVTDVHIRGFHISFYPQHTSTDPPHTGLYAARNVFSYASGMGILGSCSSCLLENNLFTRINVSPTANALSHGFYLGSSSAESTDIVIRCNRFIDNSINTSQGKCTGGTLTAHGQFNRVTVQGNYLGVSNAYGATLNCVGISFNPGYDSPEWFYNTILRDNWIQNVGEGIVVTSAPNIIIDNNTIIATPATDPRYGIMIPGFGDGTGGDVADTAAIIRNNLIYFQSNPLGGSIGIQTTDGFATLGTNVQILNNRVYMGSNANGAKCFRLNVPTAYARVENLVCSGAGNNWMENYQTLESFNSRFSGIPSGVVAGVLDNSTFTLPSNPNTCSMTPIQYSTFRSSTQNPTFTQTSSSTQNPTLTQTPSSTQNPTLTQNPPSTSPTSGSTTQPSEVESSSIKSPLFFFLSIFIIMSVL